MPDPVLSHVRLPPSEAIRYFRQKVNVPTERWGELESAAHSRAFAVAGAASTALLNDFKTAVGRALSDGTTLQEFKKSFNSIVKKHGWDHTGTPGWRAKVIYETNIADAYSAGRYRQMTTPEALELYPYWRYVHHECAHPRPMHLAWSGTILLNSDSWWESHYTPNGYNCHCTIEVVSEARMRRNQWTVDKAPPIDLKPWRNPATGEIIHVPVGIDPGFQHNPGLEWAKAEKARQASAMTPLTHVKGQPVEALPEQERQAVQKKQIKQLASMERPTGIVDAATLSEHVKNLLGSKSRQVFLSSETLMKNQTHHPNISPDDYADLAAMIADPDYVLKEKQEGRLTLLAGTGRPYRIVLKRTQNGNENFILSVTDIGDHHFAQLVRNREVLFDKRHKEKK
ncbi:hypothetical protein GS501_02465 [Saccharibacter sp. 17.LH.SD]|uniref:phage head morphogenesis protein n=1 Tax=Saccharibacter sp. 17.LH.SD TaxID=2689393 RepID=UPI00136AEBC0|nr:phage minor head protein [Saccharibacter sp. 17.LH.SD]MXV43916.1 hypothetical protein [Saccharibacter sp. 17.LH.SD]